MKTDREDRPWGWYEIVDTEPVTKILCINPGGMLSLQTHEDRMERWIPLRSGLISYVNKWSDSLQSWDKQTATLMKHGNTYSVGFKDKHRLINPTEYSIKMIEIMTGKYDEDDIVRYQDIYDRNVQ